MLEAYLNQTTQYEASTARDQYGDSSYADAISVPCRREKHTKIIQTPTGSVYQTSWMYFLPATITPKVWLDRLDGQMIAQVTDLVLLTGDLEGYQVLV